MGGVYVEIVLYENKKDCCACGACLNVCPKGAISMKPDDQGFVYPEIDRDKCIECGGCKQVCKFRSSELRTVKTVYASTIADDQQIMGAASGGMFTAAALSILKTGGVVFGAALTFDEGRANPHHIVIEDKIELWKLQGSKYVHSAVGDTYHQAKMYLAQGRNVLYSGTPCQIAGLKSYLGKEYDNLYTMDLICHGVPSADFFDGYIQQLNKKYHGKITHYCFRDKAKG